MGVGIVEEANICRNQNKTQWEHVWIAYRVAKYASTHSNAGHLDVLLTKYSIHTSRHVKIAMMAVLNVILL